MKNDAAEQYHEALKAGQKYYDEAIRAGEDPYPLVLEEILPNFTSLNQVYLGMMEIPMDLIVGTKTAGRREAFAGNFMPLLERESEFGMKWVNLCESHFEEGIHDPIVCFEYLGKFYVQEGNKRVSVLKSLGARKILGTVTRVLPVQDGSPEVELYNEFLNFYKLSRLYVIQFEEPGCYAKLQASLGYEADHVWTDEERQAFNSRYFTFSNAVEDFARGEGFPVSVPMAFLCWLQVYSYESLKTMTRKELDASIASVWPEIMHQTTKEESVISTAPEEVQKGLFSRIFSNSLSIVNVAFIHAGSSSGSNWIRGHEAGADHLERSFGSKVNVETYYANPETATGIMESAIRNGAQVLFVTAPTLLSATRRVAVMHPKTIVFVCALSMPVAGINTYYARGYEPKFVSGALAGVFCKDGKIGYEANYPIYGVPAEINAFALGARMTNPQARIKLRWSGVEKDPAGALIREGLYVISGHDVTTKEELEETVDFGTFELNEHGSTLPISAPRWNWGSLYERIVRYILNDEWDEIRERAGDEVSLWWGMDSGIIDVELADRLLPGQLQLAKILKKNVIHGGIEIFKTRMVDQNGVVRNDGTLQFAPSDIMHMDWLLDNVDGAIPAFDELLPMAQNLTRILGVYRDQIPPEKEEFLV